MRDRFSRKQISLEELRRPEEAAHLQELKEETWMNSVPANPERGEIKTLLDEGKRTASMSSRLRVAEGRVCNGKTAINRELRDARKEEQWQA